MLNMTYISEFQNMRFDSTHISIGNCIELILCILIKD